MIVRKYIPEDLFSVTELFGRSVREIACRDYNPAQINAWAPEKPDLEAWEKRLSSGIALVALKRSQIAGFTRMENDGYIDLFYIHPEFQRQGVGTALHEQLVLIAEKHGLVRLTANVSITARPFFASRGFRVVAKQRVKQKGIWFENYRMEAVVPNRVGSMGEEKKTFISYRVSNQ